MRASLFFSLFFAPALTREREGGDAQAATPIFLTSAIHKFEDRDQLLARSDSGRGLTFEDFAAAARLSGYEIAAACRKGKKPGNNQDSFLVRLYGKAEAAVFAVMDGHGMGGEEISSFGTNIVRQLSDRLFANATELVHQAEVLLSTEASLDSRAIDALDAVVSHRIFSIFEEVHRRTLRIRRANGGSTFSLVVWLPHLQRLWVANVGDSPVYAIDRASRRLLTLSSPGDSTDADAIDALRQDIESWFGPESPPFRKPEPNSSQLAVYWDYKHPSTGKDELRRRRLDRSPSLDESPPLNERLPESQLCLPKARGKRIPPRSESADTVLLYNVFTTRTRDGSRTYLPIFRNAWLAPTRGIADHDDNRPTLDMTSFIRNDPFIKHYFLRELLPEAEELELFLCSDGFMNPLMTQMMHEAYVNATCRKEGEAGGGGGSRSRETCLPDVVELWNEWQGDLTQTYSEEFMQTHRRLSDLADEKYSRFAYELLEKCFEEDRQAFIQHLYGETRQLDEEGVSMSWRDDLTLLYVRQPWL